MHQRILVAAVVAFMVAGTAQAASQGSGAGTATAAGAAAAATAATDHNASAPAAGSDLALLFGGLGAIGFVSWRRGRFEG